MNRTKLSSVAVKRRALVNEVSDENVFHSFEAFIWYCQCPLVISRPTTAIPLVMGSKRASSSSISGEAKAETLTPLLSVSSSLI